MSKIDLYSFKRYLHCGALIRVRRKDGSTDLCQVDSYNDYTKIVDTSMGFFALDDVVEIFECSSIPYFTSEGSKSIFDRLKYETIYKDGVFTFRPD